MGKKSTGQKSRPNKEGWIEIENNVIEDNIEDPDAVFEAQVSSLRKTSHWMAGNSMSENNMITDESEDPDAVFEAQVSILRKSNHWMAGDSMPDNNEIKDEIEDLNSVIGSFLSRNPDILDIEYCP